MRVLNCVQLRQPLVQPKDVVGHDTLIACSATIIVFQDIKPVEKRFALPSPFNRVHEPGVRIAGDNALDKLLDD